MTEAGACGVETTVLDEEQLAEQGFGGIVGVGQGSVNPPRLVRLYRTPEGRLVPRRSSARASRSTPAASRSSRRTGMET